VIRKDLVKKVFFYVSEYYIHISGSKNIFLYNTIDFVCIFFVFFVTFARL
jgi:hypothetical protein